MKLKFIIDLCALQTFINAQQKIDTLVIKRNIFYFEALGQGLYNSFAYDRLTRINKKIKNSFTVGITLIPSKELFVIGTPIAYNILVGKNTHYLAIGLGFTLFTRTI